MSIPKTIEEWENLRHEDEQQLRRRGLMGNEPPAEGNTTLMCFPENWYDHVPEGFRSYNIFHEKIRFKRGVTDRESRAGFLAFGIFAAPDKPNRRKEAVRATKKRNKWRSLRELV